jgi:UDP-N-acetylglucosamine 2-epimerase (non-hydrolysing)
VRAIELPIHVMAIYGTRPEAVKMAPLVLALRDDPRFRVHVTVTGQHREMLDQVNATFGIVPESDLDIHTLGQSLPEITGRVMEGVTRELSVVEPDAVLVQGDTSTTFVAALAAFYARVPVVHAEAGLRTNDPASPFPEEINRRLTSQLTSVHLAPTARSKANLLAEGIREDTVFVTGNSVIDALHITLGGKPTFSDPDLAALMARGRPVVLVTAHRRESWGEPLRQVGRALARLAGAHPQYDFVFPMHRNPTVRNAIIPSVQHCPNVLLTEPLPYSEFCALLDRSDILLSDSGGIQEEGPSLGKPVLVMRDTTERPEALEAGTVALIGTDEDRVVQAVSELIEDRGAYHRMSQVLNPYGDGRAAERTVQAIAHHFGVGFGVDEFDYAAPRVRQWQPS